MTTVTNKNGIEFDIDAIATDLNNKVDLDGTNATYPHVVSRTPNSQGGVVEIWSDGYCVQTGVVQGTLENNYFRVTLSQAYKDSDFYRQTMPVLPSTYTGSYFTRLISSGETNSFVYFMFVNNTITTDNPYIRYRTEGYIR